MHITRQEFQNICQKYFSENIADIVGEISNDKSKLCEKVFGRYIYHVIPIYYRRAKSA